MNAKELLDKMNLLDSDEPNNLTLNELWGEIKEFLKEKSKEDK